MTFLLLPGAHTNGGRRGGPQYGPPITGSMAVPATDTVKLQDGIQSVPNMPGNSNGEALLSPSSFVNVVSPLTKGASTAPVVISPQHGNTESKDDTDV